MKAFDFSSIAQEPVVGEAAPARNRVRILALSIFAVLLLLSGRAIQLAFSGDPLADPRGAAAVGGIERADIVDRNGELLATTSGDAVMATIAKWFGVPMPTNADVDALFPTLRATHPNTNWTVADMGFMNP